MKRLFTTLAALAALNLAGSAVAADGVKIASVDLRKIAQESKAGAEATKNLNSMKESLGTRLKTKEAELKKLLESIDGKGKPLTAKEKAAKQKEAQKKYEKLQESLKAAESELLAKEEEYSKKILAGVEAVIKEFSAKNGYSLIVRKGDMIYTDGKYEVKEITDDILKLYDDTVQKEAEKKQP